MVLATKNEYCLGLTCYSSPIFSVTKGLLTVRLLKYKYSLRPIFTVSCMPDKMNYISAYHGAQATLTDDILSFDQKLPSLPINQLKNETAISFKMRPITDSDLIDKTILPIFHQDKVAFLCVKQAVVLVINSQSIFCNAYALQFRQIPTQLMHNNKSLILRNREHHFITNVDLEPTKIFVESFKQQTIDSTHWDKISNTIRQLEPIHYAFGSLVFFIVFVMLCCLLGVCYKNSPPY